MCWTTEKTGDCSVCFILSAGQSLHSFLFTLTADVTHTHMAQKYEHETHSLTALVQVYLILQHPKPPNPDQIQPAILKKKSSKNTKKVT